MFQTVTRCSDFNRMNFLPLPPHPPTTSSSSAASSSAVSAAASEAAEAASALELVSIRSSPSYVVLCRQGDKEKEYRWHPPRHFLAQMSGNIWSDLDGYRKYGGLRDIYYDGSQCKRTCRWDSEYWLCVYMENNRVQRKATLNFYLTVYVPVMFICIWLCHFIRVT